MHFITVSRKLGANGTEIARRVADRLGYTFLDTEAIESAAREMGFLGEVQDIDERPPSLFRRFFSTKPIAEVAQLTAVMYELAKRGDAVFVGRGSHILLSPFRCALNVRVTASRETRIRNLVSRGYHEDAAPSAVDKSDHERASFIRFAFGVDWDKAELYDIVLNTDSLGLPLAVDMVIAIARSEDIMARSLESLSAIERRVLASQVEAALIGAGLTVGTGFAVSASVVEADAVLLNGLVESPSSKSQAEEVAKAVKGVKFVNNQIRVLLRKAI